MEHSPSVWKSLGDYVDFPGNMLFTRLHGLGSDGEGGGGVIVYYICSREGAYENQQLGPILYKPCNCII
jgi:hypothetical protein